MWDELNRTGGGPLAGRFTEVNSSVSAKVDFQNRIDMNRVGLIGHSRGGRAVMYQAADLHRAGLPQGVKVRAVVTLAAPPPSDDSDPSMQEYTNTDVATMAWKGTCDGAVSGALNYVTAMSGHNTGQLATVTVAGANHNFLNTQWSPMSGQVQAADDATHIAGRAETCEEEPTSGQGNTPHAAVGQLSEQKERDVATTYLGAFLRQQLVGETDLAPLLSGHQQPYTGQVQIVARIVQ